MANTFKEDSYEEEPIILESEVKAALKEQEETNHQGYSGGQ